MKMVRARTLSQYRSGRSTELGRVRRRKRGGRRDRGDGPGPFRPRRRDQGAERSGQQTVYPVAPMQPGYPGMPMPPWAQPYGIPGYPPGYAPQPVPGTAVYPQPAPGGYPAPAPGAYTSAPPAPQTAGTRIDDRYGRRFSPPAQLGANLRLQAAEGSRAAIVELEPGMFLVAEVPDEMTRSEFGIASVLAPMVINTATKALTKQLTPGSSAPAASAPGSSAPIYTCYPQGMAPQQTVVDTAVQQGVTALVSTAKGDSGSNALSNLIHKGTSALTRKRDDDVSGWAPRPWWEER